MTGPADPVPGPFDLELGPVLRLVEALAVIQEHTTEQVMIPDFTTVTKGAAGELVRLAHLLREGSAKVRWAPFDLGLPEAPSPAGEPPRPMSVERPCTVHLNGREVVLGTVRYELASAQIESVMPMDGGGVRVRLIPGQDQTATLVYESSQPN